MPPAFHYRMAFFTCPTHRVDEAMNRACSREPNWGDPASVQAKLLATGRDRVNHGYCITDLIATPTRLNDARCGKELMVAPRRTRPGERELPLPAGALLPFPGRYRVRADQ